MNKRPSIGQIVYNKTTNQYGKVIKHFTDDINAVLVDAKQSIPKGDIDQPWMQAQRVWFLNDIEDHGNQK